MSQSRNLIFTAVDSFCDRFVIKRNEDTNWFQKTNGMLKISFCTAIMNRLKHLKQTLPQNIADNLDYGQSQFVILDYNSSDGLPEWINSTQKTHLESGRLIYFRTNTPKFFHRSHSRNLAFKLADGDVVCNIDADNFLGKGFAQFVNESFKSNDKIFLAPMSGTRNMKPDYMGKICCRKSDFNTIGGYCESMEGYGFEDYDLTMKLQALGLCNSGIPENFFEAIEHSDLERVSEERTFKLLWRLYLSHVSPSQSKVIFLLKNGTYFQGSIIDKTTINAGLLEYAFDAQQKGYHYVLEDSNWIEGSWITNKRELVLKNLNPALPQVHFIKTSSSIFSETETYHKIRDKEIIINLILFESQLRNRARMQENMENPIPAQKSFGNGTVIKNFNNTETIQL